MDKDVVHIQWNITQPGKEQNNAVCSNMNGSRDDHVAPDSSLSPLEQGGESKACCAWNPKDELTDKAETDPQMWKRNAWLPKAKGRGDPGASTALSVFRPCRRAILVNDS